MSENSDLDYNNIMNNQPTINIGMIGSVSDGKSTIVKRLTTINTQRHSSERKGNKTINLGYANAKIFKCPKCPPPICYQSYPSEVYDPSCQKCESRMDLKKHVSFVDVPGHNSLMATMLNGTCVMDSTIIVEAVNNNNIPAPQTLEHLIAAKIMELDNKIVCMNKMDLEKRGKAIKKIEEFTTYLKENDTVAKDSVMIPICANFGINKDVLCEHIAKLKDPERDLNLETKMIIIRSFKNNKPEVRVQDIKGGVVGGTIVEGVLRIGDRVEILPGLIQRRKNRKDDESVWLYKPLKSHVKSIRSEKNNLELSIPGGLVGVQLTLDPGLTAKDGLVGNILRVVKDDPVEYGIFEVLRVFLEKFRDGVEYKIKVGDKVVVNYNARNVDCTVQVKKKNRAELVLDKPICAQIGDNITISKKDGNRIKLLCRGEIAEGDNSDLISL